MWLKLRYLQQKQSHFGSGTRYTLNGQGCGLRHRAAMGISQVSDAHAIIVSEETGSISVAYKGQFYLRLSAEELESLLTKEI